MTRFILLLLISQTAIADTIQVDPVDIIDVLSEDWNGDGTVDRAVLVKGDIDADLYLYLSRPDGTIGLSEIGRSIAWHGAMAGTLASLENGTSGSSFYLHSQNDSIGRNRWSNKLTIAIRNDLGLVAGYTHNSRDTLNLDDNFMCDLNLLNGRGLRNGIAFKSPGQRVSISDWSTERLPRECLD